MSAQSHWGWRPRQSEGIWRHGCAWTKPLFAAVPWVTLAILLALFAFIGDRLPQVPGLVCDLPARVAGQAEATGLAALVLPASGAGDETLVFFDDARYSLSDDASREALRERLGERAAAEARGFSSSAQGVAWRAVRSLTSSPFWNGTGVRRVESPRLRRR